MRALSSELSERLAAADQTFAHVWRVTRADGAVFGFTDHDRDISVDGLTCQAASGWTAGASESAAAGAVDAGAAEGGLDSAVITPADIDAGLWDGARVELFKLDWRAPQHRLLLREVWLGEITRGAIGFAVELRGVQALLNAPVGRVFSRLCDAELGDGRCGLDLAAPAFSASGVVQAVLGAARFSVSGVASLADGWCADGAARFADGRWRRVLRHDLHDQLATIELFEAGGPALAVNAAVTLRAGCDKRFSTCRAKFANGVNFRGFPHMPGNDVLMASPATGGRHDGGSRTPS
jgi:uncharacterized phage protein (TIGR02218 family)